MFLDFTTAAMLNRSDMNKNSSVVLKLASFGKCYSIFEWPKENDN